MKKWLDRWHRLAGLSTHKLRSFLTVLGVVIGVAAVITLMSIGEGTRQRIMSSLERLGTNLLFVRPARPPRVGSGAVSARRPPLPWKTPRPSPSRSSTSPRSPPTTSPAPGGRRQPEHECPGHRGHP